MSNKTSSSSSSISKSVFDGVSVYQLLWYGTLVRIVLIVYSMFHDYYFRVKYTDIDYMIVVDGARAMANGGSPFERTTYRYTPLLAALVLPAVYVANPIGKIIFTMCDVGAAYYCYRVLRSFATEQSAKVAIALFILFNPIVLNVSTRGNSDMLITFMSMTALSQYTQQRYYTAAAILGFASHFKIYPIIYTLPLSLGVWEMSSAYSARLLSRLTHTLPQLICCGFSFCAALIVPTYACYLKFGQEYLDEAFVYHVHREDHRHNFSPYWLLMYLNMGRRALHIGGEYSAGMFAFIPQCVVLCWASWRLRHNVAQACCVETVLFVTFNKVCTVQYFVWFLPFFAFVFVEPLHASTKLTRTNGEEHKRPSILQAMTVITLWSLTIPLWVTTAYPLEFEGVNHFGRLWIVSCIFFLATVCFATWLGRVCYFSQLQTLQSQVHSHSH